MMLGKSETKVRELLVHLHRAADILEDTLGLHLPIEPTLTRRKAGFQLPRLQARSHIPLKRSAN